MKSERAKNYIEREGRKVGNDIVLYRSGFSHAVKLAEQDARERAIKAFCKKICPQFYPCRHGEQGGCAESLEFLKNYDNEA